MSITQTLLKKYFSGTCTPEEEKQVIEYLSNEDSDLSLLEDLLEQEKEQAMPQAIPPVMLKSLIYGIRKEVYPGFLRSVKPAHRRQWYPVGLAAMLLLLLVFVGIQITSKKTGGPSADMAVVENWDTVTNLTSATKKALLPDGSDVWLTAGSSLSYIPARYGVSNRVLRLDGEAFFDVRSDSSHPFIVFHGAISTRVLGTAFNIEAYGNEDDIRISLVRGKVAIDTAMLQPLRHLEAGEQLVYRKQGGKITVKPLLYKDESMWTRGWIVFDDVPLTAALKRLERQYNLQIIIPQDIATGKKVTAIFKGGSPTEILHNMLFAHRLVYVKKGNTLYIERKAIQ